jgi:hypothetical protein
MLFRMHGRLTARIKKHVETQEHCKNCKSFDLDIKVYRDFYHFIFIPIMPVGDKVAKIYCNQCGEGLRTETIRRHYEKITRTPFWLYTGPILVALVAVIIVIANLLEQRQNADYVNHPKIGDVYELQHEQSGLTTYYFLRVSKLNGDSVYFFQNDLDYLFPPSKFDDGDFFREDNQAVFTTRDLKQMLDSGAINSVNRRYKASDGFQRIQKE